MNYYDTNRYHQTTPRLKFAGLYVGQWVEMLVEKERVRAQVTNIQPNGFQVDHYPSVYEYDYATGLPTHLLDNPQEANARVLFVYDNPAHVPLKIMIEGRISPGGKDYFLLTPESGTQGEEHAYIVYFADIPDQEEMVREILDEYMDEYGMGCDEQGYPINDEPKPLPWAR